MTYFILVLVIAACSALSAWQVSKLSVRNNNQIILTNKGGGQLKLLLLVLLSTSLGVGASYYIYGKRIDILTTLIIGALVAGTSFATRIKNTEFVPGDFFAFFSQGFTWPSILPKIAELFNVEGSLIEIIPKTPTPTISPDAGILMDSIHSIVHTILNLI